jgi:hypothetical protein
MHIFTHTLGAPFFRAHSHSQIPIYWCAPQCRHVLIDAANPQGWIENYRPRLLIEEEEKE